MTKIIDVNPTDTWTGLADKPDSILVDVRTNAEWSFVGIPDLSSVNKQAILIEWSQFPTMMKNKDFASNLMDKLNGSAPSDVYFLCRSGVRSLAAAALMIEAFAAQGLAVLRELDVKDDDPRVNPQGGAIALGHPLGASGARLVTTAMYQLQRENKKIALCTMCVGVGQGSSIVIEKV